MPLAVMDSVRPPPREPDDLTSSTVPVNTTRTPSPSFRDHRIEARMHRLAADEVKEMVAAIEHIGRWLEHLLAQLLEFHHHVLELALIIVLHINRFLYADYAVLNGNLCAVVAVDQRGEGSHIGGPTHAPPS
jgi:hypothetical protein